MQCRGTVVHAEKFKSTKTDKIYTKLFVPVGFEVISVITEGDYTDLAGVSDVPFRLGVKDKELKIYFDGEEET